MRRVRINLSRKTAAAASAPLSLTEPEHSELPSRVARGLGWKLFSQVALQGTRLVVGIVLAHLLTPHDFGLGAMALVLSGFIIPFADMGLGAALIQRPSLTEEDRSTAFWSSVAAGTLFTAIGVGASPLIADFYGDPKVQPLVAVLSLGFVITSFGATQRALLQRAMNFRSLEVRYVAGVVVGGIVAIVLADRGYGPWAFIGYEVALGIVSTLLLWLVVPWRPRFTFRRASLRVLGGFGVRVLGGVFFTNLSRNTDNLLIGRFLGAAPLGLYAFAYNLMLAPLTRIVGPVQQVVFPAFSRIRDEGPLADIWTRSAKVIAAVCAPLLSGVIITAPDLVPVIFGHRWHASVRIVQILCWVGILQCVLALNDVVLQARNSVSTFLRFTAASFAVNVAAFVLGLHWGVVGVATAFAIASTFLAVVYTTIIARTLAMDFKNVVSPFAGVATAVVGMVAFTLVARMSLVHAGVTPGLRLAATVGVGVCTYALLITLNAPSVIDDARMLISRRAPGPLGRVQGPHVGVPSPESG